LPLSSTLAAQAVPIEIGPRVAVYLLSRIAFGPRPGEARRILRSGLDRYVDEQLEGGPDPELEARLRPLTTLNYSMSEAVALYRSQDRNLGRFTEEVLAAKLIRAVHGANQLQEVLVDFWFNHFNVYLGDGFDRVYTPFYEKDAIRPFVLGRFRDLLGATAAHPAMLFYLDNYLSTISRQDPRTGMLLTGLNENYGRELLELHTVGVDAGYTQDDVVMSALCFTGWTIDLRGSGAFVYRDVNHDQRAKSVFGLNLPAGGGKEDGDRLLDHLAAHPATARHVSRRLLERFVSDAPPAALVDRVAATFTRTGGDLRAVMKAILGAPEFWAQAFGAGKPRTPIEFVAGAIRAVDGEIVSARALPATLAALGMPLYQCVPPTGYSNRGVDWANPSAQLGRMNFALDLAAGAVGGVSVDARGVIRTAGGNPDDPASSADALSADLFGKGLARATRDAAAGVSRGGSPPVAVRVTGLVLASPEMQAR
jgi:uncharacterized protein (DUF1800 family)